MTTNCTTGNTPRSRRWLAGIGALLFFGVLFALPLCSALMLCAMPCCHHASEPSAAVVSGGMSGCEEQCTVRVDEVTKPAAATVVQDNSAWRIAPAAVATVIVSNSPVSFAGIEHDAGIAHRSADASLHVLNSVFRI
jgi:hypothetical protein